jgi:IS30 family transposase
MVEQKTLYTVIVRLKGKQAELLAKAAVSAMGHLHAKVKIIILVNGLAFANHEDIAKGLGANVYFAHPYSSWERGSNENTNGLIRQYFLKKTSFNEVTDEPVRG